MKPYRPHLPSEEMRRKARAPALTHQAVAIEVQPRKTREEKKKITTIEFSIMPLMETSPERQVVAPPFS
jgi:hypothetical protein